jgi:hypothetical protein
MMTLPVENITLPPLLLLLLLRCSALTLNRAPDGRDVTGGWYDAGDNVKFNLPMAWSAGVLGWSIVEFKEVRAAGNNCLHKYCL